METTFLQQATFPSVNTEQLKTGVTKGSISAFFLHLLLLANDEKLLLLQKYRFK